MPENKPLCVHCHLPHGELAECVSALLRNIERTLGFLGNEGQCSRCLGKIYWLKHKTGTAAPYNPNGLNHFATCPEAEAFRKDK